jgi:thiol-disulfide isomerase/thioredoxin
MKNIFFLLLGIAFCSSTFAQNLTFHITGQKDTTVNLIKYYGNKLYLADTAEMKGGVVSFDGAKQKPGVLGIYFPDKTYFEFIYNNEDVDISVTKPDFVKTEKVKKSVENKLFLDYMNFIGAKRDEAKKLKDENAPKEKQEAISKAVLDYQNKLITDNPSTLVAKIVKMTLDVPIPESPKNPDGSLKDSSFSYRYYRDHYFDNIDLKDDRLVNSPVFHNKLDNYFSEKTLVQHPDTIVKYAFRLLDQLDSKSEMFKYVLHHITYKYETSQIMGFDKVFVAMAIKYYCPGHEDGKSLATWMSADKLDKMCEKANTLQYLVVGVVPPTISLRDTSDINWRSTAEIKTDYTVLYFWDPECGHCKKETPKLQKLYAEKFKNRSVEVFAVGKATGDDFEKWKKYIRENGLSFINVGLTQSLFEAATKDWRQFIPKYTNVESLNYSEHFDVYATPKIYLLDKDKKIVAKNVSVEQLEEIIDRLQGHENDPKLFPVKADEEKENAE